MLVHVVLADESTDPVTNRKSLFTNLLNVSKSIDFV